MANAGPKKILDLDQKPRHSWAALKADVAYVFQGKICSWKKAGCVLCIAEDEDDTEHQSLMDDEGFTTCLTHGPLDRVPYKTVRHYECSVGDVTIKGSCIRDTIMFIPNSIQGEERTVLFTELVSECQEMEQDDFSDVTAPEQAP